MKTSQDTRFLFFTKGKSETSLQLLDHFVDTFQRLGTIQLEATKTMIGISNGKKRIAWITQVGKNFIHVVFPFKQAYQHNLCFQKVGLVPGSKQYNHHFRMLSPDDLNPEVISYMRIAYQGES